MKTKDFIKEVMAMGAYEVQVISKCWVRVLNYKTGDMKAVIYLNRPSDLSLNGVSNLKFMKLCIEYAETPIEEREEEKKYTVVLPDPQNPHGYEFALSRWSHGDIAIVTITNDILLKNPSYHLTEEEIKRNHSYLWQFAKEV